MPLITEVKQYHEMYTFILIQFQQLHMYFIVQIFQETNKRYIYYNVPRFINTICDMRPLLLIWFHSFISSFLTKQFA